MKINPIGNGFPKINRGVKTIAIMAIASIGGAKLIDRKERKK